MTITNSSELAELLRAAAKAHDIYERSMGHLDNDWAAWYARYIFDRQTEPQTGLLGDYDG